MSEHIDLQQEEIPTRQEQVRMLSERVDDLQRRLRDYGCYAEELDKIIAAIPASNRVNLVYLEAGMWSLVFPQAVPANAKVSVIGIDGKRIAVKALRSEHNIELQDMPTNGIAIVHVTYPGMSRTFKVNLR